MSVYLDHNASSPLHPEVLDAMLPFLKNAHGNASSLHKSGRFLRSAVESARQHLAALVNAEPANVIFTSGGTEANNLAIKGFIPDLTQSTIACSSIEHASVIEPVRQMQRQGSTSFLLPVDAQGVIEVAESATLINQQQPDLVSVQLANNETGAIQPVQRLGHLIQAEKNLLLHTDATQAVGKINVDIKRLNVDLLTLSGHKFQGPQGCGALIMNNAANLKKPLQSGGPQESRRRAGTENVALLVGLGKAAQLAQINLLERQSYLLELRGYFEQQLMGIEGVHIFSKDSDRLPNTSFFSIPYYHGETLLMQLDQAGFELASGSACHSAVTQPSHVLTAMGVDEALALNAVRVSFGGENTIQQIDQLIAVLNNLINQIPANFRRVAN
jgi:cysteine desulfurase